MRDLLKLVVQSASLATAIIIVLFTAMLAVTPTHASQTKAVGNTTWVQVASTVAFVMQNQCGDILYLKSSAIQPATDDLDGAFIVREREVWNQTITTGDIWWVRTKSRAVCFVVVETVA